MVIMDGIEQKCECKFMSDVRNLSAVPAAVQLCGRWPPGLKQQGSLEAQFAPKMLCLDPKWL
eukprot:9528258-Karenia_brevis.AAC.1